MNATNVFDGMLEEKLLNLHTAFIGKIISVQNSGKLCSVQPLDKIKAYGQTAQAHKPITNVPVLSHVRHYETYTTNSHGGHIRITPIKKGDLVLCVCAERDISSSIKGKSTTPPVGHHQIANAIVVGLIGG